MVTNIMNNTKTTTLAVIAAVLIAATLVAGGTFAATSTHSAFAYQKKKGSQDSSKNDNAITPQNNKQDGIVSGFDNSFNQELQNVICTHPSSTCSTEERGQENSKDGIHSKSIPVAKVLMIHSVAIVLMHK
ncbi:MAG: hypothetical protein WA421_18795 [Nitrososphaeraceae archaeon]